MSLPLCGEKVLLAAPSLVLYKQFVCLHLPNSTYIIVNHMHVTPCLQHPAQGSPWCAETASVVETRLGCHTKG